MIEALDAPPLEMQQVRQAQRVKNPFDDNSRSMLLGAGGSMRDSDVRNATRLLEAKIVALQRRVALPTLPYYNADRVVRISDDY